MSTRANPTVIGVFVLGAVVLLVLALLAWGGTGLFRTRLDYVLFFDSSVIGLNNGAPVTFRGVKVGQVTDIQIRWGTPLVAVYISVEPDLLKGTPKAGAQAQIQQAVMERGLRAKLKMQSFVTGVLYVALEPAPDTPIVLRGLEKSPPELRPFPRTSRCGPRSLRSSPRRSSVFRSSRWRRRRQRRWRRSSGPWSRRSLSIP